MKSNKLSIFERFLRKKTNFKINNLKKACVEHALNMAKIEQAISMAETAKLKLSLIQQLDVERAALVRTAKKLEALS